MEAIQTCPECGAVWNEGKTCEENFHHMLFWEAENASYGEVHHLMVLYYHLQHPHLYSSEGLNGAIQLLADFVERGISPQDARRQQHEVVNSHNRTWKIKGTPAAHGVYDPPIHWTMTSADVIANGVEQYCASVRAWARAVHEGIKNRE